MAFFSFLPKEEAVLPDLAFRWPGKFSNLLRFTHQYLRGPSSLSIAERELIGAYVSALNSCNFCHSVHATLAERFGVDGKLLEAMVNDLESSPLSPKQLPVFQYVRKITLESSKVVQADVDAMTAVGWSEKTVVDVLSIAAAFAAWNRLMSGSGIPAVPAEKRVETVKFMENTGYMPWYMAIMFRIWGWFRNPK